MQASGMKRRTPVSPDHPPGDGEGLRAKGGNVLPKKPPDSIPGPSSGVSYLEVPDSGGLGRNQPGDPDMKVLEVTFGDGSQPRGRW